ncbi:MAG TPA: putative zinc-binding protein [Ruminiclostridium sp.]|nr:putative zinc-binding protein [Ruminiclostridium sp.]
MFEEVKIEKVEGYCKLCEDYAKKNTANPAKAAIMSCEGACARGEVSRRAANLIAHKLAPQNTVRICLGGAFTKDGGQRNLVRETHQAIAIEGCFVSCASRMMKGVIPDLKPVVINADTLYETCLPFGVDEVCEEEINENAQIVAEIIIKKYINGCEPDMASGECAASGGRSKSPCCSG